MPASPRRGYYHLRRSSAASSSGSPVSPLSPVRSASSRVAHSVRRKRVGGARPVSPLSDTFEEDDAAALREAASAGVPFLEYGGVEMSSSQSWGNSGSGSPGGMSRENGGWGTPGGRSGGFSGGNGVESGGRIAGSREGYSRDSSGAAEEGREMFEDTGNKSEVKGAALESEWRPGYLRRRVVLSFIAGFATIMVTLEVLSSLDEAHDGFSNGRGGVAVLWGYLPTIILVVIAALWGRLEFQAKRYIPWVLLSQGFPNTRDGDVLLLDYANVSLPNALHTSIRKRHFLVLGPLLTSLVLLVEIVLSTGVFVQLDVEVERGDAPTIVRDRLVLNDEGPFGNVAGRDPYGVMLGIARGHVRYPEGYTRGLAYQTFDLPEAEGDSSFRMEVDTVSARPECNAGAVMNPTRGGANLTVESSLCGGDIPVSLAPGPSNEPAEEQYYFVYEDLEGVGGCPGDQPLVLAGAFQVRPASGGGFENVDSAAVVCRVPFYSGRRDVTRRSGAESTVHPATEDDKLIERSLLDPIHDGLGSNGTLNTTAVTGDDYLTGDLLPPFVLAAELTPSGPPSVGAFLDEKALGDMMEEFFTSFGPLAAHYNLREDNPKLASGTTVTVEQRLRVVPGIAHSMTALLGVSLLLAIPLAFYIPKRGITPRCPNSIAGTAVLLVNSEDIFKRLYGADTSRIESISERLRGLHYSTVEMGPSMRNFVVKRTPDDPPTAPYSPPPHSHKRSPNGYNPWVLRPVFRLVGMLITGAFAGVLWGLIAASNNNHGLGPVSDPYHNSILWTCLPAAALVAVGAYFKTVDFQTRFLAPFSALYNPGGFAAGMMTAYTDELAPITAYKAVRDKSWAVVLAKATAVLAVLTPIFVCRLYTAEGMTRKTEVQVRQVEWFDGIANEVSLVDPAANNVSFPWVHDDLVFPTVEVTGDMRVATVEAKLPAVRAELACEPLEAPGGDLSRVDCKLLDTERDAMCGGHTNDFFGHVATRCASTLTGEEFPGSIHYLWGSCKGGVIIDRTFLSCEEKVVEVQVEATLKGVEELSIVAAEEDTETRRETDIVLPKEKVYKLREDSDPWFDPFFALLSRTTTLRSETAVASVTSAIKTQHSLLRAQALTASRTSSDSQRRGTRAEKATRLVQHRVPTYLLAATLTLSAVLAAASVMVAPSRALPCSPGSVGAVAGMLAEWGMRVVPIGAEWMGDAELRRYFQER